MKFEIAKKTVSFALVLCMIFGLVSCKEEDTTPYYDENRHIEIITKEVEYSDAFIESASEKYLNIISAIAETSYNVTFGEEQKNTLVTDFKLIIIPTLCRVKINEEELNAILTQAEKHITDKGAELDGSVLLALYEIIISEIKADKSGALIYEFALYAINSKAETSKKRYDTYGYSWYLKDYNRYTELYNNLVTLGESKFVGAISISASVTSLIFSKTTEPGDNIFSLTPSEFLFILDSQGQHFKSHELTSAEWQVIGELVSEIIPNRITDLYSSFAYALKKDEYIIDLTAAMPEAVSLYASVARALKWEGVFRLDSSKASQINAIVSALVSCEEDIRMLDAALLQYAKTDSSKIKQAVEKYVSADEINSFCAENPPIDCNEFILRLKAIKQNTSESNETLLINALASYICGYNPYISFIIFGQSR